MVHSYLAEDEAAAARIQSENGLESYSYNLRNSITDEKLADKFEVGDKVKLESAVNKTIQWLNSSQEASKEEYEEKKKELEVSGERNVLILPLPVSNQKTCLGYISTTPTTRSPMTSSQAGSKMAADETRECRQDRPMAIVCSCRSCRIHF